MYIIAQTNPLSTEKHSRRKSSPGALGQHRTLGATASGGSFAPIVQYEKWEIHPVFPHFSYFRLCQNLSPNLLAPLCGAALADFRNCLLTLCCNGAADDLSAELEPLFAQLQCAAKVGCHGVDHGDAVGHGGGLVAAVHGKLGQADVGGGDGDVGDGDAA